MDRTAFATCALLLAPFAVSTGCGVKEEPAPPAAAPLVLAELQELSPGPWRSGGGAPIAPASLERAGEVYPAPSVLDDADIDALNRRMQGPQVTPPLEGASIEPAAEPATSEAQSMPSPAERSERRLPDVAPIVDSLPEAAAPEAPAAEPAPSEQQVGVRPRTLEVVLPPPTARSERLPSTIAPLPQERGALPWAGAEVPSPEMQAVLEQADQRLREGFRLADRRAFFLARAEFLGALELIAQANDLRHGTQFYSEALAAGVVALEESRDFVQQRPLGKPLDVARVVSGHRTKLLREDECESMSPLIAARRYYTYAQEQLAGAAAGESRSSIALYGLGKIATTTSESDATERMALHAQAMVLHQAALMSDRANFRAANELGVLLARHGDLPRARALFVHSVRLSPHPSTYRNLSVVHTRLGEQQLAVQATEQAVALERAGMRRNGPAVQWVDPVTFAGTAPPSTDTPMPPVAQQTQSAAGEAKPAAQTADKSFSDWLPWKTRR